MDQLPRLGKRELICLLLFTCNYVVSVWRGFLFLWVLGMGYVILLWHSLSLPYNYFVLDTAVDNKLHSIKSILGKRRSALRTDRKEEVVLARLRIGHRFITHSYLLKGEEQPTCVPCDTPFTIKHINCIMLIFKTCVINITRLTP